MRSEDRKVFLGKIGKPHGLKGFVFFRYYGNDPQSLLYYKKLLIEGIHSEKIININSLSNRLIIQLSGYSSRNEAEKLRDKDVFVPETELPVLDKGEFYLYQLEGMTVINLEGKNLGIVGEIIQTGANSVLALKATSDSIDDKERLLPYVKREVVKEISAKDNTIYVFWPKDF